MEALDEAIANHLARAGNFRTLDSFRKHTGARFDESILDTLHDLHTILAQLDRGDCSGALAWLAAARRRNDDQVVDPNGDLEFALRQEEFVRILLGSSPSVSEPLLSTPPLTNVTAALRYGGAHLLPMMTTPERKAVVGSLLAAPLYLPFSRLLASPYASLFAPYAAAAEQPRGAANPVVASMLADAYLGSVGLARQSALEVAAEIGMNGAVAKIQKVQSVMRETKTEWTTVDELPVEIALPTRHRYHSIFACPVSKEQASAKNPPMMLPCGHVIARESMLKQAKSAPCAFPFFRTLSFDLLTDPSERKNAQVYVLSADQSRQRSDQDCLCPVTALHRVLKFCFVLLQQALLRRTKSHMSNAGRSRCLGERGRSESRTAGTS